MTKLEAVLKDVIGKMPTYMRPPNFECNDECLKLMTMLGYHVIHENLDTQDFKNTNTIQVSKDIVTKAVDAADSKKNNFIVYANEIHEATVDQLTKHMIEKFKEKGYKCELPSPNPLPLSSFSSWTWALTNRNHSRHRRRVPR